MSRLNSFKGLSLRRARAGFAVATSFWRARSRLGASARLSGSSSSWWGARRRRTTTPTCHGRRRTSWHRRTATRGSWYRFWNKNSSCRHFLSINLTSIHMLDSFICIIWHVIVNISRPTRELRMSPVTCHLYTLHLTIHRKYLHYVILVHITCQATYVNLCRTWRRGACTARLAWGA